MVEISLAPVIVLDLNDQRVAVAFIGKPQDPFRSIVPKVFLLLLLLYGVRYLSKAYLLSSGMDRITVLTTLL